MASYAYGQGNQGVKQSEPIDCSWVEKTLRRHFEINDLACELLISAQGDATAAQTIIDKVVKFQHSSECPKKKRLPLIKMLDCLISLPGGTLYFHAVTTRLLELFSETWEAVEEHKSGLVSLYRSWQAPSGDKPRIPPATLGQIGRFLEAHGVAHPEPQADASSALISQLEGLKLGPSSAGPTRTYSYGAELPPSDLAWIGNAGMPAVKRRLWQLRQEQEALKARLRELEPTRTSTCPMRLFCWCGAHMKNWVLGNTYCGREHARDARGHKLSIVRMECKYCRTTRPISLDADDSSDTVWKPTSWACPNPDCAKEFHGADCRKAGSDIVSVH